MSGAIIASVYTIDVKNDSSSGTPNIQFTLIDKRLGLALTQFSLATGASKSVTIGTINDSDTTQPTLMGTVTVWEGDPLVETDDINLPMFGGEF